MTTTVLDLVDGYDALREGVAAAPLSRDAVRVEGPDAATYLQGQLSQDVAALAVGGTTWSFLLQPQGKVDAWMRVHRLADDAFLLDVDAGAGAVVEARLRRFLLRTKADISPVEPLVALALRGPGSASEAVADSLVADSVLARLPAGWPGVVGVDVLAHAVSPGDVPLAPAEALEALRIEAGVPVTGHELTDRTIPAEVGQWVIDASVSFTKGCYTGQELVARIDSRGGNVPRPVRGLVVAGDEVPPAGAAVLDADGTGVGAISSSARSPRLGVVALAIVARDVEVPGDVRVVWDGTSAAAEIRTLPLVP